MRFFFNKHRACATGPWIALCLWGWSVSIVHALELPENQGSLAYHRYSGNSTSIEGSRLSIRQNPDPHFSLAADYQYDTLYDNSLETAASAKPYRETQQTLSLHGDHLRENSLVKVSLSGSSKPDYASTRLSLDMFQEGNSGLNTLSMGYSRGWDTLEPYGSDLREDIDHHNVRFGLTQVLSRHWSSQLNYEFGSDAGALGNPYINALLNNAPIIATHPSTRSSHSFSAALLQHISRQTLSTVHYRYFVDDWDIHAHTLTLNYAAPLRNPFWHLDSHLRFYRQDEASFYANNATSASTYLTHDKNFSRFNDIELGMNARLDLSHWFAPYTGRIYGHLAYAMIFYDFENYSQIGNDEKLFSFKANVLQCYITVTY